MSAKFSPLKNYVSELHGAPAANGNHSNNGQSWSDAIFSRDLFQTNINRVHSFFNRRTDLPATSSSSADDMQILLQKGDNDPILPALVRL